MSNFKKPFVMKLNLVGCAYHLAGACVYIADREVMRTATIVVFTAGGCLERAASPGKAVVCILIDAAAGGALGTRVVTVADGWGLHWRWWRRAGIGRILATFDRVRGLHHYTTFASGGTNHITCHSDVALLSPAITP